MRAIFDDDQDHEARLLYEDQSERGSFAEEPADFHLRQQIMFQMYNYDEDVSDDI
jgi:hypothetical protein